MVNIWHVVVATAHNGEFQRRLLNRAIVVLVLARD